MAFDCCISFELKCQDASFSNGVTFALVIEQLRNDLPE